MEIEKEILKLKEELGLKDYYVSKLEFWEDALKITKAQYENNPTETMKERLEKVSRYIEEMKNC